MCRRPTFRRTQNPDMYPIIRREAFSDTTFLWEVAAPDVAPRGPPGTS